MDPPFQNIVLDREEERRQRAPPASTQPDGVNPLSSRSTDQSRPQPSEAAMVPSSEKSVAPSPNRSPAYPESGATPTGSDVPENPYPYVKGTALRLVDGDLVPKTGVPAATPENPLPPLPSVPVNPRTWYLGLQNVGETCFLNSIVFSLLSMDRFRHSVLDYQGEGPVTRALKDLIYDNRKIEDFVARIRTEITAFQSVDQYDCHHFFNMLCGKLEEEGCVDAYNLFSGQSRADVRCRSNLNCRFSYSSPQFFLTLPLSLPESSRNTEVLEYVDSDDDGDDGQECVEESAKQVAEQSNEERGPSLKVSVEDCLEQYITEDLLDLICTQCFQQGCLGSSIRITLLPAILCLHIRSPDSVQLTGEVLTYRSGDLIDEVNYRLAGVVQYNEAAVGGGRHYVSFFKVQGEWLFADDENVRSCSINEVLAANPYVVFYEKS